VGLLNSCAATAAGNVLCWSGTTAPAPVAGFAGGVAVSAGGQGLGYSGDGYFDCAVTTAGAVSCLGDNGNGQLGNGSTVNSTVPTPVTSLTSGVTALSAGIGSTGGSACAVMGGNVWCWGYNGNDQLGNGTTAASSPVPVELIGFTGSVTAVSMGLDSACAIAGGGVWCWGYNGNGQLGNNSTTSSAAPVQVTGVTSGATAISVGDNYACALVSGGVSCWGTNGFGQSLVPAAVTGLASGVTSVSVGAAPTSITGAGTTTGGDSACAVISGAVECWGNNGNGQLGNNSTTSSAVPVTVAGLTSGVAAVSVGYGTACALTSSGGVWCWGSGLGGVPLRVAGFPQ
jgi:alpha-tubulin suppressor-like RCC1 family protein